jgi:phage shock protein PspC (stress-responsive transcriptional regulator)
LTAADRDGALLAGVCAGIARTFNWNVWALRALFVIFLLIKTVWAVIAYAVLALAFHFMDDVFPARKKEAEGLSSPELSERSDRIADLERRFRELESED